jgi:uncharacterized protein YcfJ
MNKSMIGGILIGVTVAAAAGSIAAYKKSSEPAFAEVIGVKPVKETYSTPREVCHDEQVTHTQPVQDEHRITGTLIGAVAGGVLGNQIGSGDGRKIATVAGAAAGGYAGNRVQGHIQDNNTYQTTQRHCETVQDKHQKTVGYDVRYRLGDKEDTVRMDHDPGQTLPVKDGKPMLTRG